MTCTFILFGRLSEIDRVLNLRDRLRQNSDERQRYERVKRDWLPRPADMNAYGMRKRGDRELIEGGHGHEIHTIYLAAFHMPLLYRLGSERGCDRSAARRAAYLEEAEVRAAIKYVIETHSTRILSADTWNWRRRPGRR